MPLSPEDRAAFLELLPSLGPGGDRRDIVGFTATRRERTLDELGALPGFDQVRAGVLRLLPDLAVDPAEARRRCADAAAAVRAFAADAEAGDPTLFLARHPAWVGLALLELADLGGWGGEDAMARAAELAGRGFARLGPDAVGEGEVLWAMAEQAEEVGWTDRAEALLERAADRPFAHASRRHEVVLLLGLNELERGEARGEARLTALLHEPELTPRTRTHARWVLARCAVEAGDSSRAVGLLRAARAEVDPEEEPEVAARLDRALADLA